MRSVSLASDSSCLVAGNNKACPLGYFTIKASHNPLIRADAMFGRSTKKAHLPPGSKRLPSFKLITNT
jgi:hypothetical protein